MSAFLPFNGQVTRGSPSGPMSGFGSYAHSPYGDDLLFSPLIAKIQGLFVLYEMSLNNIPHIAIDEGNGDAENALGAKFDNYDRELRALTQQLSSLRLEGKKITTSVDQPYTVDGLIQKSISLFARISSISRDPAYNNSGRKVVWHMRGPKETFTQVTDELLEYTRAFCRNMSIYTRSDSSEEYTRSIRNAAAGGIGL